MKPCMSIKWILTCFFTIISVCTPSDAESNGRPLAPALYAFGDSLLDSGNNNLLPTLAKADFLPYGVNFAQGPTGRFTNGKTVVDFIAEYLGLPLAPAYLSVRGLAKLTGINYASGSCGILADTGKSTGKCLSLAEQIDMFQTTVKVEMPTYSCKSAWELSAHLSEAVFSISVGSNDYINNYLLDYGTRKLYSPQSFAELLINQLSLSLQKLYELGARKMVVFEIGPIGCIPFITKTHSHTGRCVNAINRLAKMYNQKLARMMNHLRSDLEDSELVLGRVHGLAYHAIIHPSIYGLEESRSPCCTTWENGTSACIPNLVPCLSPDSYFFWDGFHLTEAVYRIVGSRCIHDSSICTPKNIKELVNA